MISANESAVRFGESVLGRFMLVFLAVLIGPGSEGPRQAGLVGAELEGAALETVLAGDHRVPASSWAGMRPARSSCRSGMWL